MTPKGKIVSTGSTRWPGIGPFIFAVHHLDLYPEGDAKMGPGKEAIGGRALGSDFNHPSGWSMYHSDVVPGFPSHPHRGFETISIIRSGHIDHADSTGAGARMGRGDVQWVTAGDGVVHSEMFPLLNEDKANPAELYQIWLNLPAKSKRVPPEFKMLWREDIPVITRESTAGTARVSVVAGKFDATHEPLAPPKASWASDPSSDTAVWVIDLDPGASIKLPPTNTPTTKRMIYVHGQPKNVAELQHTGAKVNVGGLWIDEHNGFEQEPGSGERLTITNGPSKPATLLVLQSNDIGEPVVQHGPFVMNSQQEIMEAFQDYRRTEFGGWPYPNDRPVYERSTPRFAKYSADRIEFPEGKPDHPVQVATA